MDNVQANLDAADRGSIADALDSLDPTSFKSWKDRASAESGLVFVGCDVNPQRFEIHDDGSFSGSARLLCNLPVSIGTANKPMLASVSYHADIAGEFSERRRAVITDLTIVDVRG
jgi:hypothetical protein